MTQAVVSSFNLFVDSNRYVSPSSTGDDVHLPLSETPIQCADNQYIRVCLQDFTMYSSFTRVNSTNNRFRVSQSNNGADTGAPLIRLAVDLPPANYSSISSLSQVFAAKLASILAAHTGKQLADIPITSQNPVTGALQNYIANPTTNDLNPDNVISFTISFKDPHGMTAVPIIQFLVEDGDTWELLGGDRVWDTTDVTTPSIDCSFVSDFQVKVKCKYPARRSTCNHIYLRTDLTNTNIQTPSFSNKSTPNLETIHTTNSRILGKCPVDKELCHFLSQTGNEYTLTLKQRQFTMLRLFITDQHGRMLPLQAPGQNLRGNRGFTCTLKIEIVQNLIPHGRQLQNAPDPESLKMIPPRFGTESLNHFDYGRSGYAERGSILRQNR